MEPADITEVSQNCPDPVVPKSDPATPAATITTAAEPEIVTSEAVAPEPTMPEHTTAAVVSSGGETSSCDVPKERDLAELKVDSEEVTKSDADVNGSVEMNDLSDCDAVATVSDVDVDMNIAADRQNVDSDVKPSSTETNDGRKFTF